MNFNFKDKTRNTRILNEYMLSKTLHMFEYANLPETIPHTQLERLLQCNGYTFVTEVEGKLYALKGGLGGVLDEYDNPTEIIVSNQALKLNKTFNLKNDGVLVSNDGFKLGLLPLYNRYNFMIVENEINCILHGYSTRMNRLLSASDDRTKASAETFVNKAIAGDIAIIGETPFLDGVKLHTSGVQSSSNITSLIEYQQYLKATMYHEVGLNSNNNMKRERLVSGEVRQVEDSLFSFVFAMLKNREDGITKINEKYGLNIEVSFGGVWANKFKEMEVVDNVEESETVLETSVNGTGANTITETGEPETGEPEDRRKQEELTTIDEILLTELDDQEREEWLELKKEYINNET